MGDLKTIIDEIRKIIQSTSKVVHSVEKKQIRHPKKIAKGRRPSRIKPLKKGERKEIIKSFLLNNWARVKDTSAYKIVKELGWTAGGPVNKQVSQIREEISKEKSKKPIESVKKRIAEIASKTETEKVKEVKKNSAYSEYIKSKKLTGDEVSCGKANKTVDFFKDCRGCLARVADDQNFVYCTIEDVPKRPLFYLVF